MGPILMLSTNKTIVQKVVKFFGVHSAGMKICLKEKNTPKNFAFRGRFLMNYTFSIHKLLELELAQGLIEHDFEIRLRFSLQFLTL